MSGFANLHVKGGCGRCITCHILNIVALQSKILKRDMQKAYEKMNVWSGKQGLVDFESFARWWNMNKARLRLPRRGGPPGAAVRGGNTSMPRIVCRMDSKAHRQTAMSTRWAW